MGLFDFIRNIFRPASVSNESPKPVSVPNEPTPPAPVINNHKTPAHNSNPPSYYIVFDIETTGLSRTDDRIIEIAASKYLGGNLVDQYHTYVNPGFLIYPHISKLTGITNSVLEDAPTIEQVQDDFLSFIGSSKLIGHNIISFDIPFLCTQMGIEIHNRTIDTLKLAKSVFPGLPSYKLSYLDQALHLGGTVHHRAQNDVDVTHQLYLACKKPEAYQNILADKDALARISIEPRRKGYGQIDIHSVMPTAPNADPHTPLTGKCIVFSGVFSMPIDSAMQIAVDAGAILKSHVSRKVHYLVLGEHDWRFKDENGMTSKERTARKLIAEGHNIQIVDEKEFLQLAKTDTRPSVDTTLEEATKRAPVKEVVFPEHKEELGINK